METDVILYLSHLILRGDASVVHLTALYVFIVFFLVIAPSLYLFGYVNRKLAADFEARVGPMRAGPAGMLQPLADSMKLFFKEKGPRRSLGEVLSAAIVFAAVGGMIPSVPIGDVATRINADLSVFNPFVCFSLAAIGLVFFGYFRSSTIHWLGAVRFGSAFLTGWVSAAMALVSVGVGVGGFRWRSIQESQGAFPWEWGLFSWPPFMIFSFIGFYFGGMVMMGPPPFPGLAENKDIGGGVSGGLSGRELSMFLFSRKFFHLMWSLMTAQIFLGGGHLPQLVLSWLVDQQMDFVRFGFEAIVVMFKAVCLMILATWFSNAQPQFRVDQATDLVWQYLCPAGIISTLGILIWRAAQLGVFA